jgi:type II secretory pathway pseudopilin PulG
LIKQFVLRRWISITFAGFRRLAAVQAGLGLVETLVAVAILGVTAVTFLTSLSTGTLSVNTLEQQTVGQELARTQMEAIKAADYDMTGVSYSPVVLPPGYAVSINAVSNIYADKDIQKIVILITYHSQQITRLEGYKVNRL